MSLIGIRDLSVIETPPKERQSIQTFVTSSQNNMAIKEVVMNEASRGDEVFYVYNKVESIDEKYLELKTFTGCKYCLRTWENDTTNF